MNVINYTHVTGGNASSVPPPEVGVVLPAAAAYTRPSHLHHHHHHPTASVVQQESWSDGCRTGALQPSLEMYVSYQGQKLLIFFLVVYGLFEVVCDMI